MKSIHHHREKQETKGRGTKMAHCLETLMELNENYDDNEDDYEYRNDLYRGHYPNRNETRCTDVPIQYDFDNERTEEDFAYLSCLMDLVSGTPDEIRYRQDYCRIWDHLFQGKEANTRSYFTGSKAEGLELPGSDQDYMIEDSNILVLQSHKYEESLSTSQRDVFIMETDHVRPCFTLLRRAQVLISNSLRRIVQPMGSMLYLSSYLYVLSKKQRGFITAQIIQGPSLETYNEYCTEGHDQVYCLKCDFWPFQANEWLHRHRPSGWPSDSIIQRIRGQGCHLVAVGHPLSERKEMEWRLSFSIAERELVWSFNHIQMQCYALLKLLLKQYIKPRMDRSILCSYFVKTIMFWEIESQSLCAWTRQNLSTCFKHLIRILYEHVVTGHLRHYFIADFNLFEIKVNGTAQRRLKEIIKPIVNVDILSVMSKCEFLNPIVKIYRMLYSNRLYTMHQVDRKLLIRKLTQDMFFSSTIRDLIQVIRNKDPEITLISSLQTMHRRKNVYFENALQNGIIAIAKRLQSLKSLYYYNKFMYRVFQALSCRLTTVETFLKTICKSTWLFHSRNFSKCLSLILHIPPTTDSYCMYYSNNKIQNGEYQVTNYVEFTHGNPILYRQFQRYWMFDLLFSVKDMDIVPAALQVELMYCDPFMGIYISPFVYIKYLQFLCFHGLHDFNNRDRALHQLRETANSDEVGGDEGIRYHSYNIAGHCLWYVGRYSEARVMFIQSVLVTQGTPHDKYNSAWHYLNMLSS